MNLQTVDFVIQEAVTNLRRDRAITFATVGVVAVSITVFGGVMLFFLNLALWTSRLAGELKATVYLNEDVSSARATNLKAEIADWEGVASARVITKEDSWEKFKETHPGLAELGEFPIPWTDAIEVKTKSAADLAAIATRLGELGESKKIVPSPEQLSAKEGTPQKVMRLRRGVHYVGYLLAVIMMLAGFLIVHNTIRLSLIARRQEIAIMQYVGATPGFVAAPFLLEGAAHGLIGAIFAGCLLVPAHMYLRALAANSEWALFQLLADRQLIPVMVSLAVVGMLLGAAGAWLSLRRFLTYRMETESN